jgi:hypothetical protein
MPLFIHVVKINETNNKSVNFDFIGVFIIKPNSSPSKNLPPFPLFSIKVQFFFGYREKITKLLSVLVFFSNTPTPLKTHRFNSTGNEGWGLCGGWICGYS